MRFGGMQKNSFVDYPGKISCVLFAQGCNFKCPYCHNPKLVPQDGYLIDIDSIFEYLSNNKDRFFDSVVISGGEPTLQEDLPEVCERIKAMGYFLKLDTNGSKPQMLEKLVNMVDYIAMDIKTVPDQYISLTGFDWEEGIIKSIGLLQQKMADYEFRTTCVKPVVDSSVVCEIGRILKDAKRYVLQPFNPAAELLDPEFLKTSEQIFTYHELKNLGAAVRFYSPNCIICAD